MRTALKRLILMRGGDGSASFLARPTGAATLTIAALAVSAATTIDWGDGSSDIYTGSSTRTHAYAGAGTYKVRILQPQNVTVLNISSSVGMPITLNSADVKALVNVTDFRAFDLLSGSTGTFNSADVSAWRPTTFYLYSMPAGYAGTFNSADVSAWRPAAFFLLSMPAGYGGTFNSADVSAWRPTTLYLYSMPAGYGGTFNSADVSAWRPAAFYLYSMPAGYAGTFNSADVSAWRPTTFYLLSMPAGYVITISAGGFSAWTGVNSFQIQNNNLSSGAVNQILADLYTAAQSRTVTGGTINLSGTNAAPGGTYAAACPPTTGKEYAYELINDSCGVIAAGETWTSITVTGGLP